MDKPITDHPLHEKSSSDLIISSILLKLYQNPQKIGLIFNDLKITNLQLLDKILLLSEKFKALGVAPNHTVAVLLDRSPETIICMLALWKIGATYIPLDTELPKERLQMICEDLKPTLILSEQHLTEKLNGIVTRQILIQPFNFDIKTNKLPEFGCLTTPCKTASSSIAYIIYTSGSTGLPKGVEISHASLHNLFEGIIPLLELSSMNNFIGLANFSFDIAFFEIITPFMLGATLVLVDKHNHKDPQKICSIINEHSINIIQATPSLWMLLNHTQWNPKQHNLIAISTGEALPIALAQLILQQAPVLWNLYGPTECTIWASAKKLSQNTKFSTTNHYVSIGQALPGYELGLQGMENNELSISGKGLAEGYHNQLKLTEQKFPYLNMQSNQRTYLTGDIASYQVDEQEYYYHGRIDNQVKHNSYRIELEEIEVTLESHHSINQALCYVIKNDTSTASTLIACLSYNKGMPNKAADRINSFLEKNLPYYMLPQKYYFLESLPITKNAKKDRKALLKSILKEKFSYNHRAIDCQNKVNSNNQEETKIAEIFCSILNIDSIGLYDSFFDMGGNSMLVASLSMAINNQFNSNISLSQLLLTPPTVHSTNQLLISNH